MSILAACRRLAASSPSLGRSGSVGSSSSSSASAQEQQACCFQQQGVTTLVRLLQSKQGPSAAAPHLPLLVAVLMQALDPGQLPVRRACLQVNVLTLELVPDLAPTSTLILSLPMMHSSSLSFSVVACQ